MLLWLRHISSSLTSVTVASARAWFSCYTKYTSSILPATVFVCSSFPLFPHVRMLSCPMYWLKVLRSRGQHVWRKATASSEAVRLIALRHPMGRKNSFYGSCNSWTFEIFEHFWNALPVGRFTCACLTGFNLSCSFLNERNDVFTWYELFERAYRGHKDYKRRGVRWNRWRDVGLFCQRIRMWYSIFCCDCVLHKTDGLFVVMDFEGCRKRTGLNSFPDFWGPRKFHCRPWHTSRP